MGAYSMCGINGFSFGNAELIKSMNKAIKHRGPDDEGFYVDDNVSLGHVRLAIIDLSPAGHQPMFYSKELGASSSNHHPENVEKSDVGIVFNGEIYNFRELREELEKKGYKFTTNTDTEVILASYLEWGFDCVKKFNGMWAFAIYDKKKNLLFLSRDRFGIKPLYYYYDGENIIFSSEIKAILKHPIKKEIRPEKIAEYLMFRGAIGEDTLYGNIKRLCPANNLVFNLSSKDIRIWDYWKLRPKPEYQDISFENALNRLNELIKKSVARRLIADVKVGAILSGGLDSSVVTAYMKDKSDRVITFTVRFKSKNFDEGIYAKKVAEYLNTDHYEVFIDFDTFIKEMEEYARIKDEPIGVPNEVALYFLSKHIRNKGVYVVLSGEGSDEIFYGYSRIFRSPFDLERMKILLLDQNPTATLEETIPNLYKRYGKVLTNLMEIITFRYPYWSPKVLNDILKLSLSMDYLDKFENIINEIHHDDYHRLSYFFIRIHLPILLNRVDNSTMANAVESRVPFLDHELVEFVFSLPNHYKSSWKSWKDYIEAQLKSSDEIAEIHDVPKYILKKLAEGKIPDEIIERKKMGFPVPFVEWKIRLLEYAKRLLLSPDSKILNFVNKNKIEDLIQASYKEENNYSIQRVWMLISLELWLRYWGEAE